MAKKRRLKTGFTTGAAAAAAVKGALLLITGGVAPYSVRIPFLCEGHVDIRLDSCRKTDEFSAVCTVIKDGGDDPDVTHRALIGATVRCRDTEPPTVNVIGGTGIGRVTKPGLGIDVGKAAINPGPMTMISMAVTSVLGDDIRTSVDIELFVPEGERLAEKTLNSRLGIIGGISILGTTGIVRPLSHDAYIATIRSAMSVAAAAGNSHVVLTTGRRSERFSMDLWPDIRDEAFIQIGDFFKMALDSAVEERISSVTLAVFFGKAVKMAQGVPHTHAAKSSLSLSKLSQWALEATGNKDLASTIAEANTARHAFDYLVDDYPDVIRDVGLRMITSAHSFAGKSLTVRSVVFDYNGNVVFDSSDDRITGNT